MLRSRAASATFSAGLVLAVLLPPAPAPAQNAFQDRVIENLALISLAEENCRIPVDETQLTGTLTAVGLSQTDLLPRGRYHEAYVRHVLAANRRMQADRAGFCARMQAEFAAILRG